jgi:hypothetical protein
LQDALLDSPKILKLQLFNAENVYFSATTRSFDKFLPVIAAVFCIFLQTYSTEPVQTSTSYIIHEKRQNVSVNFSGVSPAEFSKPIWVRDKLTMKFFLQVKESICIPYFDGRT